jgi:hypothetical protein
MGLRVRRLIRPSLEKDQDARQYEWVRTATHPTPAFPLKGAGAGCQKLKDQLKSRSTPPGRAEAGCEASEGKVA